MKLWMVAILAAAIPAMAVAEVLKSENLEAELTRRSVSMTAKTGDVIQGEQVYVTMRRRSGQPIGAPQLRDYVGFAEKAACGSRDVLVSLMVGATQGVGRYEVLCASGD